MTSTPLRILVVDDTVTYRHIVRQVLTDIPNVEVVGVAANGCIAIEKVRQLAPDLLTLDMEMPQMDGLGVLRHLKQTQSRVGAIMLSAHTARGAQATTEALQLGAFDFVLKPSGSDAAANAESLRRKLAGKIEAFQRCRQVRSLLQPPSLPPSSSRPGAPAAKEVAPGAGGSAPSGSAPRRTACSSVAERMARIATRQGRIEVVAVGVSTGGPRALAEVLPQLPADLPVPVLIVQHMPPLFTRSLADDLNRRCPLDVCEAAEGQRVGPGHVLIAPGGKQMRVEARGDVRTVQITEDPPENSCRPSVDYLFRSVARTYGPNALAVIMTGMGNDGSAGCRLLKQQGALVMAQDQASCVVYGMPREPIEQGLADVVAPLDRIAGEIVRLVGKGAGRCA